jgi:hypothetical protein
VDHLSGVVERKRAEQHGVHHAEHCGVRADAKREREHGRGREPGRLLQLS